MDIRNVAVIGLGLMGTQIASLLLKAGYRVTGFDIVRSRTSALVALGLMPAASPRQAAAGTDLVILSLPNWRAVEEVTSGADGLLATTSGGQIVIDTSTSPPWESRLMALSFAAKRVYWMDAPISGSSAQAKVGNIVFMVGGRRAAFRKIKPVLERISKKTIYIGKNGDAAKLKLVVNHTLFLNQAAAIEGFALGIKAGLAPSIILDAMLSGAASSDLIAARGKDMLEGRFDAKGPVTLAIKDLSLSLELAKRVNVVLPMGALYLKFLSRARSSGWDKKDATVVMKLYEQQAGTTKNPKKTFSHQ